MPQARVSEPVLRTTASPQHACSAASTLCLPPERRRCTPGLPRNTRVALQRQRQQQQWRHAYTRVQQLWRDRTHHLSTILASRPSRLTMLSTASPVDRVASPPATPLAGSVPLGAAAAAAAAAGAALSPTLIARQGSTRALATFVFAPRDAALHSALWGQPPPVSHVAAHAESLRTDPRLLCA